MEWPRQTSLKLIDEVRTRRCLWDPNCSDYKNRLVKHDNYSELGILFNVPAREVESKWHNLKSQFVRENNKVLSSKKYGTGREFIPRWYAYDALLFLKQNNKPRSKDTTEVQILGEDIIKDEYAELIEETSISENSDPLVEENTRESVDETPISFLSPCHKKHRSDYTTTQLSNVTNECLTNKDDYSAFSKFVETELYEIKNKRRLAILKKKIQDVIFEAKMEELDEIESNCSSATVNLVSVASTSSRESLLRHSIY